MSVSLCERRGANRNMVSGTTVHNKDGIDLMPNTLVPSLNEYAILSKKGRERESGNGASIMKL